jgi:hypothetical protein
VCVLDGHFWPITIKYSSNVGLQKFYQDYLLYMQDKISKLCVKGWMALCNDIGDVCNTVVTEKPFAARRPEDREREEVLGDSLRIALQRLA